eukprot:GHVQ01022154.1.p1 GENE.GHVQ01022154.1~~GHVQ01022154.1.p1  ORF type:complete len:575 (+),score=68.59 GHVQ01022154.1:192-1916(+)
MCGILAILGSSMDRTTLSARILELSKLIRHRGPDWNGLHVQPCADGTHHALAHERLSIVGVMSGHQPLFNEDKTICATVNGEIYNHTELRTRLSADMIASFRSQSDCQVLPYLYQAYNTNFVESLDGMFSFVIADATNDYYMAARDPLGICPLYIGYHTDGSVWFASELKCLQLDCARVETFPPGHVYTSTGGGSLKRYFEPVWWDISGPLPTQPLKLEVVRDSLVRAVEKRLMTDVPFGVLLSGGVDSSLIAAIVNRLMAKTASSQDGWFRKLHSFSIGLTDSPDLLAARRVADHIGTCHHEFTFEVNEGIDALKDVIYHLETYDVTTIRAATPMYFLSRLIKSLGVKMVLSGEGADEIFGGYLYFHKAPSKADLHRETQRKLHSLHLYDVLRANKATMAFGVEARVPFLDKEFLEVAMSIDPQEKMCIPGKRIEKWILREAFAKDGYLPADVLWRQKEQFSDGVGYNWIDGIKDYAEKKISSVQMNRAPILFPFNTPTTKEAYLYRCYFHERFHLSSAAETVPWGPSIACSSHAAIDWDASFSTNADQSGRSVLGVHQQAIKFADVTSITAT